MREFREYGSARGALSNERPYRDPLPLARFLDTASVLTVLSNHLSISCPEIM